MPGDHWQKFANIRLLFGYMYSHPGKKLVFMGDEFGQRPEWNHESSMEWHSLQYPTHQGVQQWVRDLNHLYREAHALYDMDFDSQGFEWMDFHDWENSVICFLRKGKRPSDIILAVLNLTPISRKDYIVGVPKGGFWRELLNSDGKEYGGSGLGNSGGVEASPIPCKGKEFSLSLILPPLAIILFKWEPPKPKPEPAPSVEVPHEEPQPQGPQQPQDPAEPH
jgi:1,4-alpha-glucan branching enzyme